MKNNISYKNGVYTVKGVNYLGYVALYDAYGADVGVMLECEKVEAEYYAKFNINNLELL